MTTRPFSGVWRCATTVSSRRCWPDAAPPSYMSAVEAAGHAGVTHEEIVGALIAVLPVVGVARVVSAAPNLGLAIGYDVGDALERLEPDRPRA